VTTDEWIARHGVTKCPPAICAETTAVLPKDVREWHYDRWLEQERARKNETPRERRQRVMRSSYAAVGKAMPR